MSLCVWLSEYVCVFACESSKLAVFLNRWVAKLLFGSQKRELVLHGSPTMFLIIVVGRHHQNVENHCSRVIESKRHVMSVCVCMCVWYNGREKCVCVQKKKSKEETRRKKDLARLPRNSLNHCSSSVSKNMFSSNNNKKVKKIDARYSDKNLTNFYFFRFFEKYFSKVSKLLSWWSSGETRSFNFQSKAELSHPIYKYNFALCFQSGYVDF